jgi:multisubunit Na+/H+ antiporter MnhG subunit
MSPASLVAAALLSVGVSITLFCCVASACVRGPLARLHYVTLAATAGATLVVAAAIAERGASKSSAKALVVLVVLVTSGGALGHATARAHRQRARRLERDRDQAGRPS